MTALIFIIFIVLVIICAALSALFYYHIQRYAFVGDASKRVFLIYSMITLAVIGSALIFLILNHIL